MTDQDRTIASLKSLIADLNGQITNLSAKISSSSEKAQFAIKEGNRITALAALRAKKFSETAMSQRSKTLSQLEEVYSRIEQATDHVAIIRIMKGSLSVLRDLRAEIEGTDTVEDVIAELKDEMDKVEEIGRIIDAGIQEQTFIDKGAIDEELEKLEKQAKVEQDERAAEQSQETTFIENNRKLESSMDLRRAENSGVSGETKDAPSDENSDAIKTPSHGRELARAC